MLKHCVDLVWHGEIAEQQPALYAIIAAARLAHGRAMQSYLIMMAQSLRWRSRFSFSRNLGPLFEHIL